jgi:hypothetical protein
MHNFGRIEKKRTETKSKTTNVKEKKQTMNRKEFDVMCEIKGGLGAPTSLVTYLVKSGQCI